MSGQPDIKSRIAENIARALDDSELSIAEIARRMGKKTNEKTIRRWRDGEATPGPDTLARFGSVVGRPDHTWFYLPHDGEKAVPA